MQKAKAIETPLMKQYNSIKSKHPDAILLFRVGDFYETFGEDAITTSKVLGIVLTKRANGSASEIELAGIPYHALDTYLPKLIRAGYRVAICDQLEDPKLTKKIVKRGVTEVVTPGIAYNDKILDHKNNNFLASVHFDKEMTGVSFVDISTGEFFLAQGNVEYIDKLLQSFQPAEIIFTKHKRKEFKEAFGDKFYTYTLDDWVYNYDYASEILLKHFGTTSLKGFGVDSLNNGVIAAGATLHYLGETQHSDLKHISSISRIEEEKYVWLDKFTIRNLELVYSPNEGGAPLIKVLDQTISPMGARLLKRWMLMPLKDKTKIEERLGMVEYFIKNTRTSDSIKQELKQIGDMERLISKVPLGKINPREVIQLKRALESIENIIKACEQSKNQQLKQIAEQLNPCASIIEKISNEIKPDPPALVEKGNIIQEEVSKELDELRNITHKGKEYLLEIQKRESDKTKIYSL